MATEGLREPISFSKRWRLLLVIVLAVTIADQSMKAYAVAHWKGNPPQSFFGDVFRITYAENTGAFLGLFGDLSPTMRFAILSVCNGLMLAGVTIGILTTRSISMWTFLALALIVAGGVGNMIDRVRLHVVIDFWNLGIGNLRTGIFNVADVAISSGFLMLAPMMFKSDDPPADAAAKSDHPD